MKAEFKASRRNNTFIRNLALTDEALNILVALSIGTTLLGTSVAKIVEKVNSLEASNQMTYIGDRPEEDEQITYTQEPTSQVLDQVVTELPTSQIETPVVEQEYMGELIDLSHLPNSGFKAWEGDEFNTSSLQYQVNQMATTDEFGLRRINGEPLIALGTRFAPTCGERFEITLNDNGRVYSFIAVTGDVKAHTDETRTFQEGFPDEHRIIEFVLTSDRTMIHPDILKLGDVSLVYPGEVMSIRYVGPLEMTQGMSL